MSELPGEARKEKLPGKARKEDFKKGIDQEKGRRNRNDTAISIRKTKKASQLAKRRCSSTCSSTIPDYEPNSLIKALLVANGFINEQCEVVTQNKEISDIISIPPNKASSSNSIMNWLREESKLKPITKTSVSLNTSGLSFLDLDNWVAEKPDSVRGVSSTTADNKPSYIILITTHGTILKETIVPSSYKPKKIVKITASTPGTVNYIMPGEVTGWEDEIHNIATLGTHFDTMNTIGENIKQFARNHSPYYKRAVQVHDEFGSDRLSSAINAWDKCSLISSSDSTTAQEDFQNYYDNAELGYHSWYSNEQPEAEEKFYDKTYTNKGLFNDGSPEGRRCENMKLGFIRIFDCYKPYKTPRWENLEIKKDSTDRTITFNNAEEKCKLSDILYTIENGPYDNVVIIDLTCSVPSPEYLNCLYAYCPGVSDAMSEGGSKSKKRKRKSNKTRKRRRKPSRNPRKHKKHQKSKRNPNKRRTKRK